MDVGQHVDQEPDKRPPITAYSTAPHGALGSGHQRSFMSCDPSAKLIKSPLRHAFWSGKRVDARRPVELSPGSSESLVYVRCDSDLGHAPICVTDTVVVDGLAARCTVGVRRRQARTPQKKHGFCAMTPAP
jgi:hypothetical protein